MVAIREAKCELRESIQDDIVGLLFEYIGDVYGNNDAAFLEAQK